MKKQSKTERFEKLKLLREEICEKEELRQKNSIQKMWVLQKINELKKISDCDDCTIEALKSKIDQIVYEFGLDIKGAQNE